MPISFIPEKREERIRISYRILWILIFPLVLLPILYFVLQEIPESEIIIKPEILGLDEKKLGEIEKSLKTFEKEVFKDLKANPFSKLPPPPKKIGRENPFAPID